jgi:hypothetical protein
MLDVIPVGCHLHRRATTFFRVKKADILPEKALEEIESKCLSSPDCGDRGTKRINVDQDKLCNKKVDEVQSEMFDIVHIFGRAQSA